jgi:hypothetical protein
MNNKTKFSVLAVAKDKLVALRKKWGIKNRYSMAEVAHKSGLPVEYLKNAPRNYEGFLDWSNDPRFIAVNRELPAHEQAWFIARQLASRAHEQRYNSIALNRPWKWEMLDVAPEKLKQKIIHLDIEDRAHWLMLFWSTGDEFRAFIKADTKRIWTHSFNSNIVGYQLSKLRVKLWLAQTFRKIVIVAFPAS